MFSNSSDADVGQPPAGGSMPSPLRTFRMAFSDARQADKRAFPLARATVALRVSLYPGLLRTLHELDYLDEFLGAARVRDTFFFVTHKHYLAKPLGLGDRFRCAVHHYRHENAVFDQQYRRQVYRDGGLVLWSREQSGHRFAIRLRATDENRHEGDLSVLLTVDEISTCRMSYSVIPAGYVGLGPGSVLFVSRNQTSRGPELDLLKSAFRQNSPPYFCLAAIAGAATAHGSAHLAAVSSESQIAFEPRYASGFAHSYSGFWEHFGARPAGPLGYLLDVPLQPRQLSELSGAHRRRAARRREQWAEISGSATRALACRRREPLRLPPAPSDPARQFLPLAD